MDSEGRRIRFEPTIRVGDLLTCLMITVGGVGAWFTLAGKVEQNEAVQRVRDASQDAAVADLKGTLRDSIVQIHQEVADTRNDVKDLARYVRNRGSS